MISNVYNNQITVKGDTAEVELTKGQTCIIDAEDVPRVKTHRWYAYYNPNTKSYYAQTNIRKGGKQTSLKLHRFIMQPQKDQQVDHINHNTLDNRKQNLRLCTHQQNHFNQKPTKSYNGKACTSKYKGVSWNKLHMKWQVHISINGTLKRLGHFDDEEEAAREYDAMAVRVYGRYALTNFPTKQPKTVDDWLHPIKHTTTTPIKRVQKSF